MGTNEQYESGPIRTDESLYIDEKVLNDHFDFIKRAYEQAGLEPITSGSICPGFTTNGDEFQISLRQTIRGEILGSHFLFCSSNEDNVTEGDILISDGVCVTTEGRSITPESRFITEYSLNTGTFLNLNAVIEENLAAKHFKAVAWKTRLPLPL
jgi:hypothetical protein